MQAGDATFRPALCDKCGASAGDVPVCGVTCEDCGKKYFRCAACGWQKGALRSLRSHRALYHPRGEK